MWYWFMVSVVMFCVFGWFGSGMVGLGRLGCCL